MMYLNIISVSSIQDFINNSGTAKLLENTSDCVKKIMKKIFDNVNTEGNEIIYPQKSKGSNDFAIGNTIVFKSEKKFDFENLKDEPIPIELFFASSVYDEDNYINCYQRLMMKLANKKTNRSLHLFGKKSETYKYCEKCKKFHEFIERESCTFQKKINENVDKNFSTPHYAIGDFINEKNYDDINILIEEMNEKRKEEEFLDELLAGKVKKMDIPKYIILKMSESGDVNVNGLLEYVRETPLSKYLAIYRFDIDDMGEKIGSLEKKKQEELSKDVIKFMEEVKNEINTNEKGYKKLIYAGGDDLFALFPVKYALEFDAKMRILFEENISLKHEDLNLTYTQGIFIISSKTDFSECLRNSTRLMEKTKNYGDGKKGYSVISIVSEGYSSNEVFLKNREYDDFLEMKKYFKNKSAYIYQEFDKKFGVVIKKNKDPIYGDSSIKKILENEQMRLLKRKAVKGKPTDEEQKERDILEKNNLLKKVLFQENSSDISVKYENYIAYQSIIKFLNKEKAVKKDENNENNS